MEKVEKKEIRIEERPAVSRVTLVQPQVSREPVLRRRGQAFDWDFIRLALIAAFAVLVLSYVSPLIPRVWERSSGPKTSILENDPMTDGARIPFQTTVPMQVLCCQGKLDDCPENLCCTDDCIKEHFDQEQEHIQEEKNRPHTILGKILDRFKSWGA